MNDRISMTRWATVCLLLLLALATVTAGCSPSSPGDSTTTGPEASNTSTPTPSRSVTTTTEPQMMTEYDRELAKTPKIQNQLVIYLKDQQASQDDPRMGIIYGLRARAQAITGRKALSTSDLALADAAMKDVYSTLNLGRNVATGSTAQTLADAREIVATLGAPSDDPDRAAVLLDQCIAYLAPLLDEAAAIAPETSAP